MNGQEDHQSKKCKFCKKNKFCWRQAFCSAGITVKGGSKVAFNPTNHIRRNTYREEASTLNWIKYNAEGFLFFYYNECRSLLGNVRSDEDAKYMTDGLVKSSSSIDVVKEISRTWTEDWWSILESFNPISPGLLSSLVCKVRVSASIPILWKKKNQICRARGVHCKFGVIRSWHHFHLWRKRSYLWSKK